MKTKLALLTTLSFTVLPILADEMPGRGKQSA